MSTQNLEGVAFLSTLEELSLEDIQEWSVLAAKDHGVEAVRTKISTIIDQDNLGVYKRYFVRVEFIRDARVHIFPGWEIETQKSLPTAKELLSVYLKAVYIYNQYQLDGVIRDVEE